MTIDPARELILRPALCLDLDGTVRRARDGGFVNKPDDVELFPGIEARIWSFKNKGYLIAGVSNQAGVAHGFMTIEDVNNCVGRMIELFNSSPFDIIKFATREPKGSVPPLNTKTLLRKPSIGMLAVIEDIAMTEGIVIDWDNSLMVGDRDEDRWMAANAGIPFMTAEAFREEVLTGGDEVEEETS